MMDRQTTPIIRFSLALKKQKEARLNISRVLFHDLDMTPTIKLQ